MCSMGLTIVMRLLPLKCALPSMVSCEDRINDSSNPIEINSHEYNVSLIPSLISVKIDSHTESNNPVSNQELNQASANSVQPNRIQTTTLVVK